MPNDTGRILAVSQQGGHLVELLELLPRMVNGGSGIDWVTFDTPQGRSMLAGERVRFVDPIMPRDYVALARNLRPAVSVLRSGRYSAVVGSGAISLAYLPAARALGIPAHFVECATRLDGPSMSGHLLARIPGIRMYTQHEEWAGGRWLYHGAVWDNFEPAERQAGGALRRIVVTLGLNPFPFRRLLERLIEILPGDAEVLWQTGTTDVAGLPIEAHATLPTHELDAAMAAADVVVAHAGTGSSLQALDAGKVPVLVPRRAAFGEQVDEHQPPLARELGARGLAVAAEVEGLSIDVLAQAAARTARRRERPPRFELR